MFYVQRLRDILHPRTPAVYNQNNYEEIFIIKIKNNIPDFEEYFFRVWDFYFK